MQCTDGTLPPQEDDCPPGRCGKLTKPFLGTYYGAGNYFYVARLLRLAPHTGTVFLSADDFAAAAHSACAVPWLQTRAEWNASAWLHVRLGCSPPCNPMHPGCNAMHPGCSFHVPRLQTYAPRLQPCVPRLQPHASQVRFGCFSGLYISGLMQHEYGFPRASKRLAIAHTLRGAKVEWALGRHAAPPHRRTAAPPHRRHAGTQAHRHTGTQARRHTPQQTCCPKAALHPSPPPIATSLMVNLRPRSLLHEIALKGATVELIPDAAGWLPRCRAMLSSTGTPPPTDRSIDRYLPALLAITVACRPDPSGGRPGPLLVLAASELGGGHRARHVGCGVCVPPPAHLLTARRQAVGVRRRPFSPSVAPSLAKPRGTQLL